MTEQITHTIDCDTRLGKPVCNCGVDYAKKINTKHTNSEQELRRKVGKIIYAEYLYKADDDYLIGYHGDTVVTQEVNQAIDKLILLIQSEREKVLEEIKIIEPPEDVEKLKDKRQAFIAGQMNVILRAKWFPQKEESK